MAPMHTGYIPIPSTGIDVQDHQADNRKAYSIDNDRAEYRLHPLIKWGVAGVALSTTLSIILFIITLTAPHNWSLSIPPATTRTPNPYIHLERVLSGGNLSFAPIINFPPISLQFNKSDHARRLQEALRDHPSYFGTVHPDEHRIVITKETSTIVQFRNMDLAMERCILHVVVPEASETFLPDIVLEDPSVVEVWKVESPDELSHATTSSLERLALLETLTVSRFEPATSQPFYCESRDFTTLEFVCSSISPSCHVDFWQSRLAHPRGGVYMMQHSTVGSAYGQ